MRHAHETRVLGTAFGADVNVTTKRGSSGIGRSRNDFQTVEYISQRNRRRGTFSNYVSGPVDFGARERGEHVLRRTEGRIKARGTTGMTSKSRSLD